MIKTITVLLNFAFKWLSLVNVIRTIGLVQAGKQANQLASAIDRACNKTSFIENCAIKSLFLSQDSKETCSLTFVSVIKKVYQENIPFVKTIHMYVFIKGIIGKTNCYGTCVFYSICIKLKNIKNKTILNTYYIRYS